MTQLEILNKLNKYVVGKTPDNVAYFANINRRLHGYGVSNLFRKAFSV